MYLQIIDLWQHHRTSRSTLPYALSCHMHAKAQHALDSIIAQKEACRNATGSVNIMLKSANVVDPALRSFDLSALDTCDSAVKLADNLAVLFHT